MIEQPKYTHTGLACSHCQKPIVTEYGCYVHLARNGWRHLWCTWEKINKAEVLT